MSARWNLEFPVPDEDGNADMKKHVRKYLRQTLGEDSFLLCNSFFESVWASGAPYKVFMARRCLNLMYMFYICADNKWKRESLENSFFSDEALLSNAPEIAAAYQNTYVIPEILIVDEILIHGRSFNQLISNLIERIYRSLLDKGVRVDQTRLRRDVLSSVRIRVILQSDRPLLLFGMYQKNLRAEKICSSREWHQFSLGVSLVIAGGVVANTSFVPSLQMRAFDRETGNKLYRHISGKADLMVQPFSYRNRFLEKAWIYPVTSSDGAVKAIYTLRVVPSEIDATRIIVPFVIYSDVRADNAGLPGILMRKFFGLLDDGMGILSGRIFRYWKDNPTALMEALTLILSQNLLLLLLEDCEVDGWQKGMDYAKIRMTFRSRNNDCTESFFDKIMNREMPWMTLEQMNEVLLELTSEAEPLYYIKDRVNAGLAEPDGNAAGQHVKKIEDSIGDLLSGYGQEAECHAFRQSTGREFLSGVNIAGRSAAVVLHDIDARIVRDMSRSLSDEWFLRCAVSLLLRYMDVGAAAAVVSHHNARETEGGCNLLRAGEQSLFLLPQRYACYVPILAAMERDCMGNQERLEYRIRTFMSPLMEPRMTEDLVAFTNNLYRIGQTLKEWDIDWSGSFDWEWEEIGDEETLTPKEVQDRDMKEFFGSMAKQFRLLNRYIEFTKKQR